MDPIDSLAVLSTALTSLESSLSPLLENATNLISANEEITLDKAKMDVTMAYLVHDLIWSESVRSFRLKTFFWISEDVNG